MRKLKLVDGKEFLITEKEFKIVLKSSINKNVFYLPRIGVMANGNHVIITPVEGQTQYGAPWRVKLTKNGKETILRAFDRDGDGILYAIGMRDRGDVALGTKEQIEKENGPGSAVFEDVYYDLIRKKTRETWPHKNILSDDEPKNLLI